MNDLSLQSIIQNKIRSISTGAKLIVVCIRALLMTIPSFLVGNLIDERTQRAKDVVVGAIASFAAVAAAMYFTRRIDWYSLLSEKAPIHES